MTAHFHSFVDPITRNVCTLVLQDGHLGVAHPDCIYHADVAVELDAFSCQHCRWNGRVSGLWVRDLWWWHNPPHPFDDEVADAYVRLLPDDAHDLACTAGETLECDCGAARRAWKEQRDRLEARSR